MKLVPVLAAVFAVTVGASQGKAPTEDSKSVGLVSAEEPDGKGTRVRVSTPDLPIRSIATSKLTLRLECLHPTGSLTRPDRCLVYVVHWGKEAKYSLQHNTSFKVAVDGKNLLNASLSNYGANPDGSLLVEPLVGFWSFDLLLGVAAGKVVEFDLAGEKLEVPVAVLDGVREMAEHFPK